ncbi:MAG TPA: MBL fold metallo-hydrolase [Flexivirga sp.]|uniref:MBL fold metallo-hydrolase n=1 Tax=Flexivirga sp. TaxID=1962927 RepID=UPI002C87CC61|nr:MBL fold metallo-hydrolase [Flexivirga sp.]HWC24588.1 MBL fold metallo-hydrolase [Flexivirga sp.]
MNGSERHLARRGLSVHTIGTGGGPIVSSSRAGISTLIRVDGASYVVDCGMGSVRNFRGASRWEDLRAIFLTHHHSDHIYDLGAFLVTGWQVPGESFSGPVAVVGPGRSDDPGAVSEVSAEARSERGTTSTVEIVDALLDQVYASDISIRMADEGRSEPRHHIRARNIAIPAVGGDDHDVAWPPDMTPFEVFSDENVTVSAILVDHRLCSPAFGFRFETRYGSVVISGDTAYSDNCRRLARGADLLLHEVIDIDAILATFPEGPTREGIATHLRESHTSYEHVGLLARAAEVGRLVLHHIVPNTPGAADLAKMTRRAQRDFGGPVAIAEDNATFVVGSAVEEASA